MNRDVVRSLGGPLDRPKKQTNRNYRNEDLPHEFPSPRFVCLNTTTTRDGAPCAVRRDPRRDPRQRQRKLSAATSVAKYPDGRRSIATAAHCDQVPTRRQESDSAETGGPEQSRAAPKGRSKGRFLPAVLRSQPHNRKTLHAERPVPTKRDGKN